MINLNSWINSSYSRDLPGNTEVFIDGLPGMPDNLNISPEGNIFASLISVRLPGQLNPMEMLYNHAWVRKLILRLLHILKFPLDMIETYLDLPIARQLSYHVSLLKIQECPLESFKLL